MTNCQDFVLSHVDIYLHSGGVNILLKWQLIITDFYLNENLILPKILSCQLI